MAFPPPRLSAGNFAWRVAARTGDDLLNLGAVAAAGL